MKHLLLAAAALACFSAPALAYTVQAGCSVPPTTVVGPSLYVNPTAAAGGTGTQASPFNTLAAAVTATAGNGGTINLMSGNYGDVSFVNVNSTYWLKLVAVPGQTPVFTTLDINHANDMIIDGLTVQSLDQTGDHNGWALVSVSDGGAAATTHDVVFNNNTVGSLPALTGLTQPQLASELRVAGFYIVGTGDTLGADVGATEDDRGAPYTNCVSLSGNHVQNVHNGVILAANNSIFTNNQIDHFSNNGLAYAGNNLTVTKNKINDVFNNGDNGATSLPGTANSNAGATFIEGWAGPSHPNGITNKFTGITIDSNKAIRQLDASLPFPTFPIYTASTPTGGPRGIVQGANSADWWNITVTNNVVVTQGTCDGVHFPSVKGASLIVNNTVAQESYIAGGNCPEVQIQAGEGAGSSSVQILANIAPELWQWGSSVMNNNAATCNYDTNPTCSPIQLNGNRKNAGDITTKNNAGHSSFQVDTAQFANFCPFGSCTTLSLSRVPDLHLSPLSWMVSSCDNYPATANSFACNATSFFARSVPGISPPLDIDGNSRFGDGVTICTIPVPGAYAFPIPCGSGVTGTGPVPQPPAPPAAPTAPPVQTVSPPQPPSSPPPVTTTPPSPPPPPPPPVVTPPPSPVTYRVYPGCTVPVTSTTAKTWYVDPVNGKTPAQGADGSQAKPWNSIQGILRFNFPTGYSRPLLSSVPYYHTVNGVANVYVADQLGSPPVQPGDTILLMGGDYGAIAIGDFNAETANSDFVTFKSAPGQTPQFDSLSISRAKKFIFDGIKVQSVSAPVGNYGSWLVSVNDQGASYPTSDIILNNFDVSSADHTTTVSWTAAQWLAQAHGGIGFEGTAGNGTNGVPYTTCISATNNHIHDVYQGMLVMGNNSLASGNEIDHFTADGLDLAANNLQIVKNYEHDSQAVDGNHEDGMQGQNGPLASGVAYNKFSNILIDSNIIIKEVDPILPLVTYLQGISFFDEDWTNLTVTNNVIVSNSCHGISLSSIHNSLVANNTVVYDGTLPLANPGCTLLNTTIGGQTHQGPISSNVRISGNLLDQLDITGVGDTNMTWDHNVVTHTGGGIQYWTPTLGNVWQVPAGTDANGNVSPAANIPYASLFQTWLPLSHSYNLAPLPTSVALGKAICVPPSAIGYIQPVSASCVPSNDVTGAPRVFPSTAGAYEAH